MLNQVVLVGRLVEKPEILKTEEKSVTYITIAVPRSFKNENGEYETDFFKVVLWNAVAENTTEWCNKGNMIGIRGRLQKSLEDDELQIVAERVTFLSSKKKEEKPENDGTAIVCD